MAIIIEIASIFLHISLHNNNNLQTVQTIIIIIKKFNFRWLFEDFVFVCSTKFAVS